MLRRMGDGWLLRDTNRSNARTRLFCFPHSGASAAIFREWFDAFHPSVDVCAIEPPGRVARFTEPAPPSVHAFVDALTHAVRDWLDLPFAVFGYSLGATMAFEWCRTLRRMPRRLEPSHLIVAACGAPQLPALHEPMSHLPKREFRERVERYFEPIDPALAAEPEMLDMILQILRNDLRMGETYRCAPEAPLQHPILALGGADDPSVPLDRLEAWSAQTTSRFDMHVFPGNHFFLRSCGAELRALIRGRIAPARPDAPSDAM